MIAIVLRMMAIAFGTSLQESAEGIFLRNEVCMSEVNSGKVYLTRERLIEMERELKELKSNGRKDMAQKIAEARGYGDLSENAEYDAAKEAQQHLELRIAKLEETLSRTQIIDTAGLLTDKVYILSLVRLQDMRTKQTIEYRLVDPEEADFEKNKISVTSPIGKGLMGKKQGEVVKIKVPAGMLEYKIVEIGR
jgi:transcription elongation factor GreA